MLFPRDHTQVEPLRREIVAARGDRTGSRLPCRAPIVHAVWEDPASPRYPVVVLDRLPGIPLAAIVEDMPVADARGPVRRAGSSRRRLARRSTPRSVPTLPRRRRLDDHTTLADELELDARRGRGPRPMRSARARELEPVLVHGDLHEGQLLVDPEPPHRLTGILDWQTARVDHPFVEFDLGEWGTALWRGHRADFPELRRRAWDAYAAAARAPGRPRPGVRVAPRLRPRPQACSASTPSRWRTDPDIVGTVAEARDQVRGAGLDRRRLTLAGIVAVASMLEGSH